MIRITLSEFIKNVERYQVAARSEAVIVTDGDADSTVTISAQEYRRLFPRASLTLSDLTDGDIRAIFEAEPAPACAEFESERD